MEAFICSFLDRVLHTGYPYWFGLCFYLNLRMAGNCPAESLVFNLRFYQLFSWLETCEYIFASLLPGES